MAGHGIYDKIYNRIPLGAQNILMSCYGGMLYRQRYGKQYQAYLAYLKGKDYGDLDKELQYQNDEFLRFLKFAVENSPFYKEFYRDLDLREIRSLADITKLRVLEKETFRRNLDRIYTIISPSAGIKGFTGGTTGKSLMVLYTREDSQKRLAYLSFFEFRNGVRQGMRRASFNGRQFIASGSKHKVFWRHNILRKQKLYSTFQMTNENLPYYVADLNRFKPQVVNGFVSAIYDLARYINEHDIPLAFKPVAVFTTSETLLPFHRSDIERAFQCPVRNQYSSGEGAPFITECPEGNLHYNLDTGIIESCPDGQILVTGFHTHGTPLVRYAIGDSVTFAFDKAPCRCGCCHPLVESVEGRQVDYLVSRKKRKISLSHLADVIKGMPNCISNMQFIQDTIDAVTVKMVVDAQKYKPEFEDSLIAEMRYRFGDDLLLTIEKVDEIPREASGKYRLVINNVKE